jgi:hypothetical protein
MVVVAMVKEEYEVGGQNLYKNPFICYTDNTKKCIQTEPYRE